MIKDMMRRYTYRRAMRFSFMRAKVVMMGREHGYSLPQFLFFAIFSTVNDWPESTPEEQELKFMALMYLLNILEKSSFLNDLFDVLDLSSVRRL